MPNGLLKWSPEITNRVDVFVCDRGSILTLSMNSWNKDYKIETRSQWWLRKSWENIMSVQKALGSERTWGFFSTVLWMCSQRTFLMDNYKLHMDGDWPSPGWRNSCNWSWWITICMIPPLHMWWSVNRIITESNGDNHWSLHSIICFTNTLTFRSKAQANCGPYRR